MFVNKKTEEWIRKSVDLGFDEKDTWYILQNADLTEGVAYERYSKWYREHRETAKQELQKRICNAIIELDDAIKAAKRTGLLSDDQIGILLNHNKLKRID